MPSPIPGRLTAPPPGWTARGDVIVIGSGIAGLTVALRITRLDPDAEVLVVTKDVLAAGSTQWAQGGIAAVLDPADSPAEHARDTRLAGAGLCDAQAVRILAEEGTVALTRLIELGARFDPGPDGGPALTREGGHRRRRIVHAGGDATGAEVQRALVTAVLAEPRIEVVEHALALDLLRDADGRACGFTLHVMGEGTRDGVGAVLGRAVVLATGGMGQIYSSTTNPSVSTGDGVALALRAGAVIRDLEFVQFHPTVLALPAPRGRQPLISEAVRGEGAFLIDEDGKRFMEDEHELGDLAPRDVVAKAIVRRGRARLDARHFGEEMWRVRFPTILATCRSHGVDPVREPIPIVPAAHYASGGVRTDLDGRTSVPGLYACGEVACTGVHGANRLASNSLLEGLVFAERIASSIDSVRLAPGDPVASGRAAGLVDPRVRDRVQAHMTDGAGVLRSRTSLSEAARALGDAQWTPAPVEPCVESWEATNLLTVAVALVGAASAREETRGTHWREDFPDREDDHWLGHIDLTLSDGRVKMTYHAVDPVIEAALAEDGPDITSETTIPADLTGTAEVTARADGVVAGLRVAEKVFDRVGYGRATSERLAGDGDRVSSGDVLMTVTGPVRDLLRAERVALNLLTHLSGIATLTHRWVTAVAGTGAVIRDTRKTLPGLRELEKYAVRCGGGENHRMSLSDAALIKDNHIVAAGGVAEAFRLVKAARPDLPVEVECDTLDQVAAALEAGADLILLDNFSLDSMRAAVRLARGRALLEASGGLTLEVARDVAETGVDYLAVGALTHSAGALDIGLDLRSA